MPIVKVVYRVVKEEPKRRLTFADLEFMEVFRAADGARVRLKTGDEHYGIFSLNDTLPIRRNEIGSGAFDMKPDEPVIRLNATLSDVHEADEQ